MIRTSKAQLIETLQSLNLPQNQVYMIHSSMLKFGLMEGGLKGVMECLREVLGPESTIAMPAFSFNFGTTRVWKSAETPAETGALTEYFRKLPGSIRTLHPFHSICVAGPRAKDFLDVRSTSSFGPGSAFAKLYELDAYNLALGIGLVGGATFLHHVEEVVGVPYRQHKDFPGEVYDHDGNKVDQTFRMYVREISDGHEYRNEWGHVLPDFISDELVQTRKLNGAEILSFRIRPCHNRYIERIISNSYYCARKIIK